MLLFAWENLDESLNFWSIIPHHSFAYKAVCFKETAIQTFAMLIKHEESRSAVYYSVSKYTND
jgi:hypothetical protein